MLLLKQLADNSIPSNSLYTVDTLLISDHESITVSDPSTIYNEKDTTYIYTNQNETITEQTEIGFLNGNVISNNKNSISIAKSF